jgi:hypothetical protein
MVGDVEHIEEDIGHMQIGCAQERFAAAGAFGKVQSDNRWSIVTGQCLHDFGHHSLTESQRGCNSSAIF